MRTVGSLLAIVAVLLVISALFAQVMARLTGLQLPLVALSASRTAVNDQSDAAAHDGNDASRGSPPAPAVPRVEVAVPASAAPATDAPATTGAGDGATAKIPMIKSALRKPSASSVRNPQAAMAPARRVEIAARPTSAAPILIAAAPTEEQVRATQCRTLQGYEADLAMQVAATAGVDAARLSGLREQLAIARARRLELGC